MMTDDAKAILLLAGRFGGNSDAAPLSLAEYNRIASALHTNKLRPADLLTTDRLTALVGDAGLEDGRVSCLLQRGMELGLAVENWNSKGIWVLCRSDEDYPTRLRKKLNSLAPPILFGAGERSLLSGGGLAIVGSRNVDADGEEFTDKVASWCARNDVSVVSGGARGVDQFAMKSAVTSGGRVIGILADQLLKATLASAAREGIYEGRMLLISPYHPEARFNVGHAMSRNKLIYAMADAGLVVSTDYKKGGTWAGAEEELKRSGKVLVRITECSPAANAKLLNIGATRFPIDWMNQSPLDVISGCEPARANADQQELGFESNGKQETPTISKNDEQQGKNGATPTRSMTIYETVLPVILTRLETEMTLKDLAKELDVNMSQLKTWIERATNENVIEKRSRPVRYIRKATVEVS